MDGDEGSKDLTAAAAAESADKAAAAAAAETAAAAAAGPVTTVDLALQPATPAPAWTPWQVLHSEGMESTRVLELPQYGCLVQVSTTQGIAMTWIPGARLWRNPSTTRVNLERA